VVVALGVKGPAVMEPQAARVAAVRALLVLLEQEVQVPEGREITAVVVPARVTVQVAAVAGSLALVPMLLQAPPQQEAMGVPAVQSP